MNRLKETLSSTLGVFGFILTYLMSAFVIIFPTLIIDVPFVLDILFILLIWFFPITSIVFWVWSFIIAITGPQDLLAIVFYIVSIIIFIPYIINVILDIIDNFRYR